MISLQQIREQFTPDFEPPEFHKTYTIGTEYTWSRIPCRIKTESCMTLLSKLIFFPESLHKYLQKSFRCSPLRSQARSYVGFQEIYPSYNTYSIISSNLNIPDTELENCMIESLEILYAFFPDILYSVYSLNIDKFYAIKRFKKIYTPTEYVNMINENADIDFYKWLLQLPIDHQKLGELLETKNNLYYILFKREVDIDSFEYDINKKFDNITYDDYSDSLSRACENNIVKPLCNIVSVLLEYKQQNKMITRLQQLDIGSLLYYDVMKYIR
jgi:hypothetical protein